jgi:MoaA/NifB/PqqE/SkfB family radical SAM enzyme
MKNHKKKSSSTHVALNITNRCNQRCFFCFEGKRREKKELSFDEVKLLLDETAKSIPVAVFMGGEPLLRKDVFEIFSYAKSKGLKIQLFTNGQMLAQEGIIEKLGNAGISALHISLNFHDRESFIRTTRTKPEKWENFLSALSHIDEFQKRKGDTKIPLVCDVVVWKENVDHIQDMVNLMHKRLPLWEPRFAFKQMLMFPYGETLNTSHEWSAPFESLRKEFSLLKKTDIKFADLIFHGFPLCVIPEMEHFSADLNQIVRDYKIFFNFSDQERIEPAACDFLMHPLMDSYSFVCRECSLVTICPGTYTKMQWHDFKPQGKNLPFPSSENPREILKRMKLTDQETDYIIERRKSYTDNIIKIGRECEEIIRKALKGFDTESVHSSKFKYHTFNNIIHIKRKTGNFYVEVAPPYPSLSHAYLCNDLCLYVFGTEPADQAMNQIVSRMAEVFMNFSFSREEIDKIAGFSLSKNIDHECIKIVSMISNMFGNHILPGTVFEGGFRIDECHVLKNGIDLIIKQSDGTEIKVSITSAGESFPDQISSSDFIVRAHGADGIKDLACGKIMENLIREYDKKRCQEEKEYKGDLYDRILQILGSSPEDDFFLEHASGDMEHEQIKLILKKHDELITFFLCRKQEGANYFLSSENFALRHSRESRIDSDEKLRTARRILSMAERIFSV